MRLATLERSTSALCYQPRRLRLLLPAWIEHNRQRPKPIAAKTKSCASILQKVIASSGAWCGSVMLFSVRGTGNLRFWAGAACPLFFAEAAAHAIPDSTSGIAIAMLPGPLRAQRSGDRSRECGASAGAALRYEEGSTQPPLPRAGCAISIWLRNVPFLTGGNKPKLACKRNVQMSLFRQIEM